MFMASGGGRHSPPETRREREGERERERKREREREREREEEEVTSPSRYTPPYTGL